MRCTLLIAAIALFATGCGSARHAASRTQATMQTTAPTTAPAPSAKSRPFVAKLFTPTHTPRAGAAWRYRVTATDTGGRPLPAQITAQIIDPFGTPHAVQYGRTNRDIVKLPFHGTFRDFVNWPATASGYSFFFRVVVEVGANRKQLLYPVRPR